MDRLERKDKQLLVAPSGECVDCGSFDYEPTDAGREAIRAVRTRALQKRGRLAASMAGRWLTLNAAAMGAAALLPIGAQWPFLIGAGGILQRFATSGMLHESAHLTLLSRRKWNDAMGRILAALSFVDFDDWKAAHMKHHAELATIRDPEYAELTLHGMKLDGMSPSELARMLVAPFQPAMLLRAAKESLSVFRKRTPWIVWGALASLALACGPLGMTWLLTWFIASFSTRKFVWLIANATEHSFKLQKEMEDGSTPAGRKLRQMPLRLRWLAISRERRGALSRLISPESEALYHATHHYDAGAPGGGLKELHATLLQHQPGYAEVHKITDGLFIAKPGRAAALDDLRAGAASDDAIIKSGLCNAEARRAA